MVGAAGLRCFLRIKARREGTNGCLAAHPWFVYPIVNTNTGKRYQNQPFRATIS